MTDCPTGKHHEIRAGFGGRCTVCGTHYDDDQPAHAECNCEDEDAD